jgi:prephenate dehydratase
MPMIAIQGISGSYSEEAVGKMFGDQAEIVECADFAETFEAVASHRVDYALVPLRNTIIGEVESAVHEFQKTNLKIKDQLLLPVDHVLIGTPDADLGGVEVIRSHAEALKQCRKFLASAGWTVETGADTASSVRRVVADADPKRAAIASRRACEIYGGKILRENISDQPDNITYFYLVGRH